MYFLHSRSDGWLYGENHGMPSGFKGENKHVGQSAGEEGGDPGEAEAGSLSPSPGGRV